MLVYFKNGVVEADEAHISVLSPAFTHGPNVYETVRGYREADGEQLNLFRLADHLVRFRLSMNALRYANIPAPEKVARAILDCVRTNQLRDDFHLRIHAFGSDDAEGSTDLLVIPELRPPKASAPVHCRIAAWRRPADDTQPARVKAVGNRMFARVAAAEAKAGGYDQILLLNQRGKLAEGLSSNLFVVRHGIVSTPAITADILQGITRDSLIAILLEDMNRTVQEREIDRSELLDCEEAFLCSTGSEIVPIATVERLPFNDVAPGPLTSELTTRYTEVLRGRAKARANWLTPVY